MPSHRDVSLGPRVSDSQKELIISFMEQHPFLSRRCRELYPDPRAVDRRVLWRQLAAELNALGPMSKTIAQWHAWWRKQVHEARQHATHGRNDLLPRWRVRILDVAGPLPQTGVRDPALEAPENADQVPSMAVEVVLSEEPATGDATDPSQDPTLLQAWPTSRASVGTAEGTSGISREHQYCYPPCSNVPVGEQGEGGTGFASEPQQKVCRTKHRHARSPHHPNDIVTVLRGMKDAAVRQAVALERLASEARQQREVAERQAAALERLVELHNEELQELRCIGDLAQSISIDLQQRTEECE
ncbi:hypothetical protein MTO96_011240 [Rhipicephalus appendiculatus]